jgi:hypothetical protein
MKLHTLLPLAALYLVSSFAFGGQDTSVLDRPSSLVIFVESSMGARVASAVIGQPVEHMSPQIYERMKKKLQEHRYDGLRLAIERRMEKIELRFYETRSFKLSRLIGLADKKGKWDRVRRELKALKRELPKASESVARERPVSDEYARLRQEFLSGRVTLAHEDPGNQILKDTAADARGAGGERFAGRENFHGNDLRRFERFAEQNLEAVPDDLLEFIVEKSQGQGLRFFTPDPKTGEHRLVTRARLLLAKRGVKLQRR